MKIDRLPVKPLPSAKALLPDAPMVPPCQGAKAMLPVKRVDEPEFLRALFSAMEPKLPAAKAKTRRAHS